ncbi:MAG TPA: hypothetical protein VG148_07845 [Pyrinomonadaceae bacterium]|nr:hypothetical protein [Pyrinomonadaceae bacterium]
MPRRLKIKTLALLFVIASPAAALFFVQSNCPTRGLALSRAVRESALLKNRTAPPAPPDFDARVTLAALLGPGGDRGRWSAERAAVVEGYVVEVGKGGVEAANCYSFGRRDTHIYLALVPGATPRERMVLEVTPRMEAWAAGRGWDWSEAALRRELTGRRCRFEGWLFFDEEHADEAENTSPGAAGNWRATAWELHPVTAISVLR